MPLVAWKIHFSCGKKDSKVGSMDPLPSLRKPAVLSTCFFPSSQAASVLASISQVIRRAYPQVSMGKVHCPPGCLLKLLPLFLSPSSLSAHLLSLTSLTLSYDYFLHLKPVSPLFTRAAIKSTTGWVAYTRQIDFIPAMEAASPRSRCQRFWFPLWHLSLACGVVRKRDYLFFYTLPS